MQRKFPASHTGRTAILGISLGIEVLMLALLPGCQFLPFPLQTFPATEALITPTLYVPTPDCGASTLLLGSTSLPIEPIQPGADGVLSVPADRSGVAYWIDGTNRNYVFVLSPTPENLAILPGLTAGSVAKVSWSNCNSTTYSLSAAEQGLFRVSPLPDQSIEAITVFFQSDASGAGFILRGELTEEQIGSVPTSAPGAADIQAEISLLETATAPDGGSIRVGISIHNYGTTAFTLAGTDVALTQPDGMPAALLSSEPALPREIAPGATETLYFFFAHPASPTATLRLLSVEFELEGY